VRAGRHPGPEKLIALYDDNGISIDGKVEGWFTDDTPARFYGWNVIRAVDGHDVAAVSAAIAAAKKADKPTLICCKTVIGKGSPNLQGGDKVHGAALGDKEVAAVREYIGWSAAPFEIPPTCTRMGCQSGRRQARSRWNACSQYAPSSRPKPLN
jgi:transketolase